MSHEEVQARLPQLPTGLLSEEDWRRRVGVTGWMAEALAEREVTYESYSIMSLEEVMTEVLEWHGIIGFTQQIVGACRRLDGLGKE